MIPRLNLRPGSAVGSVGGSLLVAIVSWTVGNNSIVFLGWVLVMDEALRLLNCPLGTLHHRLDLWSQVSFSFASDRDTQEDSYHGPESLAQCQCR
jgi:hypothetical protein